MVLGLVIGIIMISFTLFVIALKENNYNFDDCLSEDFERDSKDKSDA